MAYFEGINDGLFDGEVEVIGDGGAVGRLKGINCVTTN